MLQKWLKKDYIQIVENCRNWKDAIEKCGIPLIKNDVINIDYIKAIYSSHEAIGPYYVLAPRIAMPHARPEDGALKMGLSLLVVKNGVNFDSEENDPIYLIILLAAKDSDSHIEMIASLSELFFNEENINEIIACNDTEEIYEFIKSF